MKILQYKSVQVAAIVCAMLVSAAVLLGAVNLYVSHKVPVSLYGYSLFVDFWDRGYVSAEGTWVIENEKHAFPLNTSSITCSRETGFCTDSSARVQTGTGTASLNVEAETHQITKWDNDTLTYTTDTRCVDYVYTINRATKQISGLRKVNAKSDPETCSGLENELRLRLTNGFDVYWKMQEEAFPHAYFWLFAGTIFAFGGYSIWRVFTRK